MKFLVFLLAMTTAAVGQVSIGTNALLTRYDNDNFAFLMNFNPGNGETVTLNPPRFRWFYMENQTNRYDLSVYVYKFQCSYNANMSSPVVDVYTPYNCYNLVDHFTNSPVYWRVGYILRTNVIMDGNGVFAITNVSPVTTNWTATRSFNIATNAVEWDRAVFADTNFLATNGVHPHLGFRDGQQSALSNYCTTNISLQYFWPQERNDVLALTNQWWWESKLSLLDTTNWAWRGGGYFFAGYCTVGSVSNVTLADNSTNGLDLGPSWGGGDLTNGAVVLVKAQTDSTENGVYVVTNGSWSRLAALDASNELTNRVIVYVYQGTPIEQYWMNAGTLGGPMSWSVSYNMDSGFSLFSQYTLLLARAAFVWQLTGDSALTNGGHLQSNLTWSAEFVRSNGWTLRNASLDDYGSASVPLCYAYDWLYSVLTADQRSNILQTLVEHCQFHRTNYCFYNYQTDANGVQAQTVYAGAMAKKLESHNWDAQRTASLYGLATYGDDPNGREWLWANLNYWLGQGMQFGDEQGLDRGRWAYGTADYFRYITALTPYYETFKAQGMTNFPGIKGAVHWDRYFYPLGYRHQGDDMWGDGGYGYVGTAGSGAGGEPDAAQIWPYMDDVARMANDGVAQRLFTRGSQMWPHREYNYNYRSVTFKFQYPDAPPEADATNLAQVFPVGGWAMATSTNQTDYGVFSNGVGFIFQARPSGGDNNHTFASDLDVEIWAYGTPVTEGGGAYGGGWEETGISHNTWLINNDYKQAPFWANRPVIAYLTAFAQGSNYVYAAGEAAENYSSTDNVLRARRHLLFMRNKYFILYDELATRTNSTFAWTWHIRPPTLSNLTANSFNYWWTNLYAGGPCVTTIVQHVAFTNLLGVKQITKDAGGSYTVARYGTFYTNIVVSHPWTGELYANSHPYFRSYALYYTNNVPGTNFHYATVIYPVKEGGTAPTIEMLDDNTVRVTSGGDEDVVTFGTNYAGGDWTLRVELAEPAGAPNGPPMASAATSVTTNSFAANWQAYGSATNYVLDVSTNSGFSDFTGVYDGLSTGDVTTLTVTNLSVSTAYYYKVRAVVDGSETADSNTITVTTDTPEVPAAVTHVRASGSQAWSGTINVR